MKSKFKTQIKAIKEEDLAKYHLSKSSLVAQANTLIPSSFRGRSNPDIMPIIYSVAVVNKLNENGDGILPIDAAKMLPDFSHKPLNIEHYNDAIVGHLVKASFSFKEPDFYENDILPFLEEDNPFFISCAGFIYKGIFPQLAELILKASDPESPTYQDYSASWEIAFSDYDIVTTDNTKLISKSNIIDKNHSEFGIYNSYLLSTGGKGVDNQGRTVGRILKGDKFPIGCAITENPAAKVKGIYSSINISQKEENVVKEDDTSMTAEQFNSLEAQIKALASADHPSSKVLAEIKDTLIKEGTEWKSKAEKTQEALLKAESSVEELKNKLNSQQLELDKLTKTIAEKNIADTLNDRMNSLAAIYEFTDEEAEIIASEVKNLPLDQESFEKYKAKAAVLFSHKKKGAKTPTATIETTAVASTLPNNNANQSTPSKTLIEKIIEKGLEIE